MSTSFREIAGIMDSCAPPKSLRDLGARYRWLAGHPVFFRAITKRHTAPQTRVHRCLSYNTWLLDEIYVPLIGGVHAGIPDFHDRAEELGAILATDYDIAALCEVWHRDRRECILEGLSNNVGGKLFTAIDSAQSVAFGCLLCDGLLVIGIERSIQFNAATDFEAYEMAGPGRKDALGIVIDSKVHADVWARKGIMLCKIDLGPGVVELYLTHTFSGNTMPGILNLPADEEREDELKVRNSQIHQLARFIGQRHGAGNIAIVTGDLNINGDDPEEYGMLCDTLGNFPCVAAPGGIQMADWFQTVTVAGNPDLTATSDSTDGLPDHNRFGKICPADARDGRFCGEVALPPAGPGQGKRYDYLFVQKPDLLQTFNLDVTRLRRRYFKREGAHDADAAYLSDHLGLDYLLIASPLE